jgi:hypothetical protein
MNTSPSDDWAFTRRVGSSLLRLLALLVFIGLHHVANRALASTTPSNLVGYTVFLEDIVFVFFALIYAYLGWEMLAVFIPWLRRQDFRGQSPKEVMVAEEVEE